LSLVSNRDTLGRCNPLQQTESGWLGLMQPDQATEAKPKSSSEAVL
jgi:hypothetical protein